jgi:serine/threonine protein kinase
VRDWRRCLGLGYLKVSPCPSLPGINQHCGGDADKIEDLMSSIGAILAQLHGTGIIHGDLTTSNMMLRLTPNSPSGKPYEIVRSPVLTHPIELT